MTKNNLSRKNGTDTSESRMQRVTARFLTLKQTAATAGRKIVAHIPADTKRGFDDGRQAGRDFVKSVPYGAGCAVGFAYGATESIVGLIAAPVTSLCTWAAWAIRCGGRGQNENHGAAEVA